MQDLESSVIADRTVPRRLRRETIRHGRPLLAVVFLAVRAYAQAGSISSVSIAPFGPGVFDATGNLYSIGAGPVTPGAAQTQNGGGTCLSSNGFFDYQAACPDAYVSKVNSAGKLVFGTYLGGPTWDRTTAIAVDAAGNVYLTGTTGGSFPTTSKAAIPTSTTADAFAAKISADGSTVLYSTYLPTTAQAPAAIAVDSQGAAYIAGTSSTGHGFVVKLSADGSTFDYNVPLAGSKQDAIAAIVADADGNIVVAGQTQSPDFPVSDSVAQSHLAGTQNVFVAKLNAGGAILFSTYLGGSESDSAAAVKLDSAGNIYVAGQTISPDFPTTPGSFQPGLIVPLWNNSASSGFVSRISADGTALVWSTYVVSSDRLGQEGTTQLAVTASGDVYAAGLAGASFAVTASAPQACFQGSNANVHVVHLGAKGALLDATYAGQNVVSTLGLSTTPDGAVLTAWSSGASAISKIVFGAAGSSAPACLSPAILNSATQAVSAIGGNGSGIAAGEWITLTGLGIGPETGAVSQADSEGQIPTELAGVQVLFDGKAAPILYAQSRQINVLAPVELSRSTPPVTTITVIYNQNTIGSIDGNILTFGVPGIFRANPGVSTAAVALNQDSSINSESNPAEPNSFVSVFGTGMGILYPPCVTGALNPYAAVNVAPGLGVLVYDSYQQQDVQTYVGSAPTLACGVEQVNFMIPAHAPPGNFQFFVWSTQDRGDGSLNANPTTVGATVFVK